MDSQFTNDQFGIIGENSEKENFKETHEETSKPNHKVAVGKNGLPINVVHEENDNNSNNNKGLNKERNKKKINDTENPENDYSTNSSEENFDEIEESKGDLDSMNIENKSSSSFSDEDGTPIVRTKRFSTILNLMNTILGAGILSVPNTFVNTGIILSTIILIIMAVLSTIATNILISLASATNTNGLGELTLAIIGRKGSLCLSILNVIFINTALVAYLVLAGDVITSFFELAKIDLKPLIYHALMILIYALCIPVALSIPRNVGFLRYFSAATVFCILFFAISMIYKMSKFISDMKGINPTAVLFKCDISMFSSLSIYALSFSLPSVVITTIQTYNSNPKKRKRVTTTAIILCFIFVMVSGVCGYLIFGDSTNANVLINFEANDILIIVCRVAFFVIVSCAYPMVARGCSAMWSALIYKTDNPVLLNCKNRTIILLLTNVIPLIIAMFLPSAKPALAIGGALGGCLVDFVFPSILFVVYHKKDYPLYHWKSILCILFCIFGFVAAVISTYQAIVDAIKAFS